ncbi:hypothetical protein ACFL2Q_11915 [Thermodesulfobacteriota bacterium]
MRRFTAVLRGVELLGAHDSIGSRAELLVGLGSLGGRTVETVEADYTYWYRADDGRCCRAEEVVALHLPRVYLGLDTSPWEQTESREKMKTALAILTAVLLLPGMATAKSCGTMRKELSELRLEYHQYANGVTEEEIAFDKLVEILDKIADLKREMQKIECQVRPRDKDLARQKRKLDNVKRDNSPK